MSMLGFGARSKYQILTRTLAENAGTIALAAVVSGAVLAGGIIAGAQLRKRRRRHAQEPYRFPWPAEPRNGADDLHPMGI